MACCDEKESIDGKVLLAAGNLVFMKHQKITKDKEAMLLMKIEKDRNRYHHRLEHHDNVTVLPKDFRIVTCLRGMVKECSSVAVEKELTRSDVLRSQNRLNLTKNVVEDSFLPMLRDDEDVIEGIPVTGYDKDGNVYSLKFIFWTNKLYVLNGEWKKFFEDHELREVEDSVKVWMFRHSRSDKLCFLIDKIAGNKNTPYNMNL